MQDMFRLIPIFDNLKGSNKSIQGDIVCIAMENRLDYCCYWMGLGMVGVTPALINNNLRQVIMSCHL